MSNSQLLWTRPAHTLNVPTVQFVPYPYGVPGREESTVNRSMHALRGFAATAALTATCVGVMPAAMGASAQATTATKQATADVFVRDAPANSGKPIGVLPKGRRVHVTGADVMGWTPVRFNGHSGYIFRAYLDTPDSANPIVTKNGRQGSRTTTANLNFRVGPSMSTPIKQVLPRGTRVHLTGTTAGRWVKVRVGDATGWVFSDYLSTSGRTAEPPRARKHARTEASHHERKPHSSAVNDSKKQSVKPTTPKARPAEAATSRNNSALVTPAEHSKSTHQVNPSPSSSAKPTETGDPAHQSAPTEKPTKASGMTTPTPSASASSSATPAPAAKPTQSTSPGKAATPAPAKESTKSGPTGAAWTTDRLNLRTNPSTKDKVKGVLPQGTKVARTGTMSGTWAQVTTSDGTGWVAEEYLSSSAPAKHAPKAPAKHVKKATTKHTAKKPAKPKTPSITGTRFATTTLNVWDAATGSSHSGEISRGKTVKITGTVRNGRAEIVVSGQSRWVTSRYLATSKPAAHKQKHKPATKKAKPATSKKSIPSRSTSRGAITGQCSASYYDEDQMTANGERFNTNDLTAAHKTMAFNTRVRVTNPANGKSVVVRVNDRGPYVAGRCLDLSRAAFSQIASTGAGVVNVKYTVLG